MKIKDTYRTIREKSDGLYKEKGSKFLSFALPIENREQAEERIAELRKKYHDARHHCFAYTLGPDQSEYRASDDGEPANSAGQPILGQIRSNDLTNILIVVVRYFGGTLLGVGGLVRAYKSAAADSIMNGEIVIRTIREKYRLRFSYDLTNAVMKTVDSPDIKIIDQVFEEKVEMDIGIRKSAIEKVLVKLRSLQGLEIENADSG